MCSEPSRYQNRHFIQEQDCNVTWPVFDGQYLISMRVAETCQNINVYLPIKFRYPDAGTDPEFQKGRGVQVILLSTKTGCILAHTGDML